MSCPIYSCPFCGSHRLPRDHRQRTMLGNVIFAIVLIAGVVGLGYLVSQVVPDNREHVDYEIFFAVAAIAFIPALILADHLLRETVRICPHCRMKVN